MPNLEMGPSEEEPKIITDSELSQLSAEELQRMADMASAMILESELAKDLSFGVDAKPSLMEISKQLVALGDAIPVESLNILSNLAEILGLDRNVDAKQITTRMTNLMMARFRIMRPGVFKKKPTE